MAAMFHVTLLSKCSRCGTEHSRFRDRERTRPASYCTACHAKHMAETRPKHCELAPQQRKAANARAMARVYVSRGKIQKRPCQVCGSEDAERHHPDYDRPLDIVWVCRHCHLAIHAGEKDAPHVLPNIAAPTIFRRSRAEMRQLRERMKGMEASGLSRKRIALELNVTPAQVTRCLGAVRIWKQRRVERG